ncbi:MAG: ribosomal protein S18-alanine N-acetyltransferase [Betaproteobacteria bacterium]|nr:ribosomal protein S18-alanine N-acetyltransferase [Betaproteobacteria bacterium]
MNAVLRRPAFDFRPMNDGDIDAVLAIEQQAYPFPWTRGNFKDCLVSGYRCEVVEQAGDLLGYSVLSSGAGEGHVLNCCVAPVHQGQGVGSELMRRMMADAKAFGIGVLFLEVRPRNRRAIELYERLGFEAIGLRRGYYPAAEGREDALVMRREL